MAEDIQTHNQKDNILYDIIKLWLFQDSPKRDIWKNEIAEISVKYSDEYLIDSLPFDKYVNKMVCTEFDSKIRKNYKKFMYHCKMLCERYLQYLENSDILAKSDIIRKLDSMGL